MSKQKGNQKKITSSFNIIIQFLAAELMNFLVCLKHILLKIKLDSLFSSLFVSKHFYEYFFLILKCVFVNLKFEHFLKKMRNNKKSFKETMRVFNSLQIQEFRLQNLKYYFQSLRLFSLRKDEREQEIFY
jgi:hypothetical protein